MNGFVDGGDRGWRVKRGVWRVLLLLVLLSQSIMGCQAEEADQEPVVVEVMRVGFDRTTDMPVVILRDKGDTRAIPIWIGPFEARAIAMELEGAAAPRPLTHDLLKSILQGAGVVFEKVLVSELKEGTYYARIFLTSAGKDFEVDSRPSDAIALALRFGKPILVARSLMEGDTALDLKDRSEPEDGSEPLVKSVRGITVQEISQGLAASLGLSSTDGVLVSDVSGSENAGLKRGDVILAVDSNPVTGVGIFQSMLAGMEGQTVRLRVSRDGNEQVVELPPAAVRGGFLSWPSPSQREYFNERVGDFDVPQPRPVIERLGEVVGAAGLRRWRSGAGYRNRRGGSDSPDPVLQSLPYSRLRHRRENAAAVAAQTPPSPNRSLGRGRSSLARRLGRCRLSERHVRKHRRQTPCLQEPQPHSQARRPDGGEPSRGQGIRGGAPPDQSPGHRIAPPTHPVPIAAPAPGSGGNRLSGRTQALPDGGPERTLTVKCSGSVRGRGGPGCAGGLRCRP